jgi:acetyl-CoA C-acetyltransferase
MSDVSLIDLYSCFAIPVFNICDAFGIASNDPRGLTVTGGLPFFGGAGNNYSAHAIVEVILRLRSRPDAYGLVGANGGVMSKYATGIYSRRPADWFGRERFTQLPDEPQAVDVVDVFEGEATIESYTLLPGRDHALAVIVGRTDGEARVVANLASHDVDGLTTLAEGAPFGRRLAIRGAADSRNECSFL